MELSRVDLSWRSWNGSETRSTYQVWASVDGVEWTLAADRTDNTTVGFTSDALAGSARYVRVDIGSVINDHNGNAAVWAAGLVEVQVYAAVDPVATDSTRPEASLVSPSTAGPFRELAIQVDASDAVGLARIVANVYADGRLVRSTQTRLDGETSASHVATLALPDGQYVIRYNAHDLAGNVSRTSELPVTVDATGPTVSIKTGPEFTVGDAETGYDKVSFKLFDAGKIDRFVLNGVARDLVNDRWSDINDVQPGRFGAVAGENTLVVHDVAGNATTITFLLR